MFAALAVVLFAAFFGLNKVELNEATNATGFLAL